LTLEPEAYESRLDVDFSTIDPDMQTGAQDIA
jgi:hypothetical protein